MKILSEINFLTILSGFNITICFLIMFLLNGCNFTENNYSEGRDYVYNEITNYFQLNPIDSNINYDPDYTKVINDSLVVCCFLSGETRDADGKDIPLNQTISISSLLDTSKRVEWDFGYWLGSLTSFFSYDGKIAYGYTFVGEGLVKVGKDEVSEIIAPLSLPEFLYSSGDYVMFWDGDGKKLFNFKTGELIWHWARPLDGFHSIIIKNYFVKQDSKYVAERDGHEITITCYDLMTKKKLWQREYFRNKSLGIIVNPKYTFIEGGMTSDQLEHIIVQSEKNIDFIDLRTNKLKFQIQKPSQTLVKCPSKITYPFYYYAFQDSVKCFNIKSKSLIWSKRFDLTFENIELWREHLLFESKDSLYIAPLKTLKIDKVFPVSLLNEIRSNNFNKYLIKNKKIYN